MSLFRLPAVVDALDDLLDRERRSVLRGDLNALVRLAPEKERLMARLPGTAADTARVARLRDKADRNQQLLAAAARGIHRARQRIAAHENPAAGLRTYDPSGTSQEMGRKSRKVEKRA